MIQAAYFSSQKGKKYLPQISGTQSKSPFPPFCPKIKLKKMRGINLHLIILLAAQLCLTRFNTMDCSLLGSTVHGILQAIILELVAIPFSKDFPDPGIEAGSPTLQADSLPSEPPGKPSIILNQPEY